MEHITLDDLVELETAVWRALADGDAAADAGLLSEDFLGVYPSGFADRGDHVGQLADGPTVADFELDGCRAFHITPSAAMLSYRATYRRPGAAAGTPGEVMYVSSLWCRRADRWINVFSQDSPAGPPGP